MKQINSYGPHLTIDGGECKAPGLSSVEFIYRYLDTMPEMIGMQKISHPSVVLYQEDPDPEEWGVTGFVLIATSHLSVHTYPAKRFIFIDIFSCKEFDVDKALNFTKDYFGIDNLEHTLVERGLRFPRKADVN